VAIYSVPRVNTWKISRGRMKSAKVAVIDLFIRACFIQGLHDDRIKTCQSERKREHRNGPIS
jgi:hypothetical protein